MISSFNLTSRHTMGLKSQAQFGAEITDPSQIETLIAAARSHGLPLHIIGGGSNLLPREDVKAIVGIMALKGREVGTPQNGHHMVTAWAGEDWSTFVEWTVAQGLYGLENLVGIPGTVGAAPIQNIGAYGLELADRLHSLTAYDTTENTLRTFTKPECEFAYRQSYFKQHPGRYIVLNVTFALPQNWQPILGYAGLNDLPADVDAPTIMHRVLTLRGGKLPDWHTLGNAGSFFHNPVVTAQVAESIPGVPRYPQPDGSVKLSAAWLIEACGLKGYRQGPVGVYQHHALILVNHGGATFTDISALATHIQTTVHQRFGIMLTQEPINL